MIKLNSRTWLIGASLLVSGQVYAGWFDYMPSEQQRIQQQQAQNQNQNRGTWFDPARTQNGGFPGYQRGTLQKVTHIHSSYYVCDYTTLINGQQQTFTVGMDGQGGCKKVVFVNPKNGQVRWY